MKRKRDNTNFFRIPILDNISMRKKLMLVYMLCAFIPITIIIILFYNNIQSEMEDRQMEYTKNLCSSMQYEIDNYIDTMYMVGTKMSTDYLLDNLLTNNSETDKFTSYNNRVEMKHLLESYDAMNSFVSKIVVYHSNNTIYHGGKFIYLSDEIRNENWYQEYIKNGKTIQLDYDSTLKRYYFVVICKLNYYKRNSENIVKICMNVKIFSNSLKRGDINDKVYLVDKSNRIISSNEQSAVMEQTGDQFIENEDLKRHKYVYEQSLEKTGPLTGWRIITYLYQGVNDEYLMQIKYMLIVIESGCILLTLFVIYLIAHSINYRLSFLMKTIKKAKDKKLELIICPKTTDEIGMIIEQFNGMMYRIDELIDEVYKTGIEKSRIEIENTKNELRALQSQINPHFLYNTLNSVMVKSALKSEIETSEIIGYLARMFRQLMSWKEEIIPLSQELEFVEDYLILQKYRFEDKLDYTILIEPDCMEVLVPKMCLQPIVENASIHGIEPMNSKGELQIIVKRENCEVVISIKDNGNGMKEDFLEMLRAQIKDHETSSSIGLSNVYKRLYLCYKERFRFEITSNYRQGTEVKIYLFEGVTV